MKSISFLVPYTTSNDVGFPAQNLTTLTTQPVGWMSGRFCTFPQELILQFQNNVTVNKVQFLSHEKKISSKIEVFIGRNSKQQIQQQQYDLQLNGPDGIKFQRIGYFTLNTNEESNWQARELKTVTIDQNSCTFLRLILHKNHNNKYNPFGQVAIVAIRVYGTVEQLPPASAQKSRPFDLQAAYSQQDVLQREETQIDQQTMEQIYGLTIQKDNAVRSENYQEAKRIKALIEDLKVLGKEIKQIEEQKKFAIQNEDYDNAQLLKQQILEIRKKAGQMDEDRNGRQNIRQYIRAGIDSDNLNQRNNLGYESIQQIPPYSEQYQESHQDNYPDQQYDNHYQDDWQQHEGQDYQNNYANENEEYKDQSQDQDSNLTRKKPLNHDDTVIPTCNMANKKKLDDEETKIDPEQDISKLEVEGLSVQSEKLAEPYIPYFTLTFCQKLFSKSWSQREDALLWLSKQLQNPTDIKMDPKEIVYQLTLQIIHSKINDKIERVAVASMTLLESLIKNIDIKHEQASKGEIPIYLENIIFVLMEKSGDSNTRIKEEADKLLLQMADSQAIGTIPIINNAIKGITTKPKLQQSSKHTTSRLLLLYNLVKKYKIKNDKVPYNPVMDFAIKNLENPAENVRSAAIYIISEAYRNLGETVRLQLENLRPALRQVIEEIFQKIDNGEEIEGMVEPEKQRKQLGFQLISQQYQVETNIQQHKHSQPKDPKGIEILEHNITTQCEFCGLVDNEFAKLNRLDLHLWRECIFLTTCLSCAQVVEIPTLSTHHLDECEKCQDYHQCTRCGVSVLSNKLKSHLDSKVCVSSKGDVCPLCYLQITGKEGWKQHLEQCENNERNKFMK